MSVQRHAPRPNWVANTRLWLVLDRYAAQPRSLEEVTGLAVGGGVDAVLCRIKDVPVAEIKRLALPVRRICREFAVPFVMSHEVQLAQELQADGLQIGAADPPIAEIRRAIGEKLVLGTSTHGVGEAQRCFADGADYVFLGPIYPTPAKLKYGAPLGIETVTRAQSLPGPVVFIGGITPENCRPLVELGARRFAAIAALQATADPAASARRFIAALDSQAME
ncbi:thiamine phosphate synthase [bacterium]|nr:thiamine phosphate synthase [bacterium]